jgi:exosortase
MTARNQLLGFASLCALSIVFWWRPLVATFDLALSNEAYTHILLILPMSLALIYMDSGRCDSKDRSFDRRLSTCLGLALLALALLAGAYDRWTLESATADVRLTLGMFALVTWWIGSVILCFEIRTLRSFLFPLGFLLLLVPIPNFALSWIVEFLQQQSASVSRIMFRTIGVPATQDGIMVYIPNLDIEVARECSSIRSSWMLIVSTMVLAHLFLRSWWRKILLVALAVPLSVAKNGLRIVTIGELGTRVDPGYLNGRFHHHGGIVFLGVALLVIVALLWILRRSEGSTPIKAPTVSASVD